MKQEIARTESLLHRDIFKGFHQRIDFSPCVSLGAGAFKFCVDSFAQRFPSQRAIAQPKHCPGQGRMMVQHDAGRATRLQHTPSFPQTLRRVRAVMHYAIGIDDVKGFVAERKVLRVGNAQVGAVSSQSRIFVPLFRRTQPTYRSP